MLRTQSFLLTLLTPLFFTLILSLFSSSFSLFLCFTPSLFSFSSLLLRSIRRWKLGSLSKASIYQGRCLFGAAPFPTAQFLHTCSLAPRQLGAIKQRKKGVFLSKERKKKRERAIVSLSVCSWERKEENLVRKFYCGGRRCWMRTDRFYFAVTKDKERLGVKKKEGKQRKERIIRERKK